MSLLAPKPSVPLETATVAESLIRPAEPRFTVPPLTVRFAPRVPLREVVPVEAVAEPLPKLAVSVPPLRVYVPAVSVPLPPRIPVPLRVKVDTVSLLAPKPNVPLETVTVAESMIRSAEPRFTVPPLTVRFAPRVPFKAVVLAAAVAVPAPKFAVNVPPLNA